MGDVRRLLTDGLTAEVLRGGDLFPLSPGGGAGRAGVCQLSLEPSEPVGESPHVNFLSVLWVLSIRCLLSLHFLHITGEKNNTYFMGQGCGN